MISFISGKIASYTSDSVVLDHNGMGFQIFYAHCDQISLNQELRIYTYMHMTENEISLFGFASQEEKELFLKLISVKGLGPKTAMNMLSKSGLSNIICAVECGDVAALRKMPGIGAKSASQIVLDLKGKLVTVPAEKQKSVTPEYSKEITDALEGLKNLGYRGSDLTSVGNMLSEKPGLTVSEYLKLGLQYMQKQKLGG